MESSLILLEDFVHEAVVTNMPRCCTRGGTPDRYPEEKDGGVRILRFLGCLLTSIV